MERPEDFGAYSGLKIVHLTDLHFGMKGQDQVWSNLADVLQKLVKPDLLLVTGDIVDSPENPLLVNAARELNRLNMRFFVCAGNHDRFARGNRFVKWFRRASPNLEFDHHFKNNVSSEVGHILNEKGWRIEVRGIDSALDADLSARGFVNPSAFNSLTVRTDKTGPVDLSLVLVHHHPMPIRSLEHKRQSAPSDLVNLTYLVNAGLLLENLAEARVDVVLHGHEHAANTACYGSLRDAHWRVAVIGGDSATGADTWSGCSLSRAGFNILWGGRDRTLRLTHMANNGGGWRATQETTILTPLMAGRSRVIRHSGVSLKGTVDSEISKHISFTRSRDMVITYRYSNWWLDSEFRFICENSTGCPSGLSLTVFGERLPPERFEGPFVQLPERQHRWVFTCSIPERLQEVRTHLEVSYTIQGGGLLSQGDWTGAGEAAADGFVRSDGLEYTSVATHDDLALAAVNLTVNLPTELTPERVSIRVHSTEDLSRVEAEENEDLVNKIGGDPSQGSFHLRIPYPRAQRLYVLAWTPVALEDVLNVTIAKDSTQEALKEAASHVAKLGHFGLALYLRSPDESIELSAQGTLMNGEFTSVTPPPTKRLHPRGDTSILGQAAWGVPCLTGKNAAGLEPDERSAVAIPVRLAVRDCPAHAVLRIAALDEGADKWLSKTSERNWVAAAAGVTRLLVGA